MLLAEDNAVSRKVAKRLVQQARFDVLEACNGAEEVPLLDKNRDELDLILMDVSMPVMDGLEATEQIREIERTAKSVRGGCILVPKCCSLCRRMKRDRDRGRGLSVGMTDYLTNVNPFHGQNCLRHFSVETFYMEVTIIENSLVSTLYGQSARMYIQTPCQRQDGKEQDYSRLTWSWGFCHERNCASKEESDHNKKDIF